MSLSTAIITGAPGWLGTRLVLALAKGLPDVPELEVAPERRIRCLVHHRRDCSVLKKINARVELISGDLKEPDSLAELFKDASQAVVFHCAGIIHPRRVREFYDVNTSGTRNLIESATRFDAKRFIYVSSISPMGANQNADEPFDENSLYNPYMNYGRSKKLAEDIVNEAFARAKIETVIVRAPWFYGPGQPERQTRFFRMIKNGIVPLIGDGRNLRSMVYVDNLCYGLLLCERTEKARGRTYWIADKKPYTMAEIIDTIELVMERDFRIPVAHKRRKMPGFVSGFAMFLDRAIQGLGFYQQDIHVLSEMDKNIFCTIGRAEKELGYFPRISLEEGMRRSLKWLLDNGIEI